MPELETALLNKLLVDVSEKFLDEFRKNNGSTPGRTRTDTGLILSQLPLPIGLRGLYQGFYYSLGYASAHQPSFVLPKVKTFCKAPLHIKPQASPIVETNNR